MLLALTPIEDYPRKDLSSYLKLHNTQPDVATELSYQLTDEEVSSINERLHTSLPLAFGFQFLISIDNSRSIAMNVDEQPVISWLISESALSSDACAALKEVVSLRAIPEALKDVDLTEKDQAFLAAITTRVTGANAKWSVVVEHEVWQHLKLIIQSSSILASMNYYLANELNRSLSACKQSGKRSKATKCGAIVLCWHYFRWRIFLFPILRLVDMKL